DSGRLANILPAVVPITTDGPHPPLATYTAGPGTEIGLLTSPTAVAITNPGTLIVLEIPDTGAQLSAYDLNGNPVRYFGPASPRSKGRPLADLGGAFKLALPGPRTYLDVAVDGSGQIYVLSSSVGGTAPSDYRIDVYTPAGAPLVTNSTGTDVPHLAVDYW